MYSVMQQKILWSGTFARFQSDSDVNNVSRSFFVSKLQLWCAQFFHLSLSFATFIQLSSSHSLQIVIVIHWWNSVFHVLSKTRTHFKYITVLIIITLKWKKKSYSIFISDILPHLGTHTHRGKCLINSIKWPYERVRLDVHLSTSRHGPLFLKINLILTDDV